MAQWVTFLVGQRVMCVRDDEIAGVVRDAPVEPLPGLRAPITAAMPRKDGRTELVDLREHEARADVLLLLRPEGTGVVVDGVLAVVQDDALEVEDALPEGVPTYVRGILRRPGAAGSRVLFVDLAMLAGLRP